MSGRNSRTDSRDEVSISQVGAGASSEVLNSHTPCGSQSNSVPAALASTTKSLRRLPSVSSFRHSVFGFPSDFEIRISDLAAALPR
jgi:hypothetical protein